MIRAFYGVPIDKEVAVKLMQDAGILLQAVEEEHLRWLDEQFWHITVKFFAKISPEGLDVVSKMLKEVTSNVRQFDLKIKKIDKFPNPRSKNLAAIIKPKRTLREIHKFLDKAGEKMGVAREYRRYRPHITLAKFNSNRYAIDPMKYKDFLFRVKEIVLYESRPTEKGSFYIPLRRFELKK